MFWVRFYHLYCDCDGERNRTTREGGGRKILDVSRRGGAKFWTSPEGGAKNFRLDQFFFNVPKTQFFHVLGVFWALFIFWSKGGRKILDASRRGGAKNFRRVLKGRKIFRQSIISDSLGAKLVCSEKIIRK